MTQGPRIGNTRADEVGDCKRANDGDHIVLVNAQASPEARGALLPFLVCAVLLAAITCDHYPPLGSLHTRQRTIGMALSCIACLCRHYPLLQLEGKGREA